MPPAQRRAPKQVEDHQATLRMSAFAKLSSLSGTTKVEKFGPLGEGYTGVAQAIWRSHFITFMIEGLKYILSERAAIELNAQSRPRLFDPQDFAVVYP